MQKVVDKRGFPANHRKAVHTRARGSQGPAQQTRRNTFNRNLGKLAQRVDKPRAPARIAFTPDLGIAPVDAEVARICAAAAKRFQQIGATIDEATIDLQDSEEIFQTLRAAQFAAQYAQLLADHRDQLKPEIIWNTEKGQAQDGPTVARAESARSARA